MTSPMGVAKPAVEEPVGVRDVERMDAELALLARDEAALRLRLGQVLQAASAGAYFELGFSSLGAYATERCELGRRWVEGAQCLARRLEALPGLRQSVAFGEVCWSRAELVARMARPDTERQWIDVARNRTVRELRALVRHAVDSGGAAAGGEAAAGKEGEHDATEQEMFAEEAAGEPLADDAALELSALELGDETCRLTCTVDREQAWLFEATRALLDQLGTRDTDSQIEAMLAEAQGVLLDRLPADAPERKAIEELDDVEICAREQSERQRAEAAAEACCERVLRRRKAAGITAVTPEAAAPSEIALAAAHGGESLKGLGAPELDDRVRELRRALCRHELELSCRIGVFLREGGWRKLGFVTLAQYARERLGMSRSSLLARRTLGSRLEALPAVAEALASGRIGVEAASQVVRVATPKTELAWLERAESRTIKHLREEVSAALVARRVSGELDCVPPAESELDAFHDLERAVVSGRAWQTGAADVANDHEVGEGGNSAGRPSGSPGVGMGEASPPDGGSASAPEGSEPVAEQRRPWRVMLVSLEDWLRSGGVRMSAEHGPSARGIASAGRIQLRLQVSRATRAWWRGLERAARGGLPRGMSWFEFACVSVWRAWGHLLGEDVAYGRIYIRDRHRCSSPVCSRRDVTPHHLQFRSAGGSDADDNIVTVCFWCHLLGIHGGRIRARGTAGNIRWELGAGKP